MRAVDVDVVVPEWIPSSQRNKKGARGWIWVDIPTLNLSVAAIHLKSSRGQSGMTDEENSHKREAIASALT